MYFDDKRLVAGVAGALVLAAGGGYMAARWTSEPSTAAAPAEEAAEAAPTSLDLSAEAIRNSDIAVEAISVGGFGSEIVAQAIVVPSPTGEAVLTARAGGAVTRVFKRLGDPVRAGEALAIVESRDAGQIAAERASAAARATLAQRNLARERYLYEQKVSSRADFEAAQAEAAAAEAEARRASAAMGAANVTHDGRGTVVSSPISGRVTSATVMLGTYVQPEAELFRVADPRQIQVEASVGPADMTRLAAGNRAVIELPSGGTLEGKVRSVTPTLSGETRTATAVIDIVGGTLQPGLGVRVRLYPSGGSSSAAVVVPEDALQSLDGKDVVFVRTSKGFRVQPVTIGQRSAGRVEIVTGLKSGETIATRNAFLLKAELGKGAGEEE